MQENNHTFKLLSQEEFVSEMDSQSINIPFQQTPLYGDWQIRSGRKVIPFSVKDCNKTVLLGQAVVFPLPFKKSYMYVPYGPIYEEMNNETMHVLKAGILEIAKNVNAIFCRFDFSPKISNIQAKILRKYFLKSPKYTYKQSFFQPRTEWVLDIRADSESLLKDMHPKTRYGVGYGLKKGLDVKIFSDNLGSLLERFYKLQDETAKRDGFRPHLKEYYKNALEASSEDASSYIVSVSYENEDLVMLLVVCKSHTANYVFGGSSTKHRNLMPNNIAHWEAILEAKNRGMSIYNFGGVSSSEDKKGQWDGISTFKKKFGGRELPHSDFYDLVVSPVWYFIYKVRKFIAK